jgi:hypothetical protein
LLGQVCLEEHLSAEDRSLEQWFLVAFGDDDKAKDAVAKATNASDEAFEVVGHILQQRSPAGGCRTAMFGLFSLGSR